MDETAAARLMVADCEQAMRRSGDTVLTVLLGDVPFDEWRHYPDGDVRDGATGCRFYYHAHAASERVAGEHGHFHTFVPGDDGRLTHIAAISVDTYGRPFRLFTVNRWVTDDAWRTDDDTIALLDRFVVDAVRPSWVVSRWVSAMVACHRPTIAALIRGRSKAFAEAGYPDDEAAAGALEDRRVEVLTQQRISPSGGGPG